MQCASANIVAKLLSLEINTVLTALSAGRLPRFKQLHNICRILRSCFAVKLQKSFVDGASLLDFPPTWGLVDNDYSLLLGERNL